MFHRRYSLSEVARILKRSERSVLRDIRSGVFRVARGISGSWRSGRFDPNFDIRLRDLEHYVGRERAAELFVGKKKKAEEIVEAVGEEGRVKKCRTCGKLKPVSEFSRVSWTLDWLSHECKDCERKRTELNRQLREEEHRRRRRRFEQYLRDPDRRR
jgi:hypothetical protein